MNKEEISRTVSPLSVRNGKGAGSNAPVAVMDSGVGGIDVLREIRALLPQEDLLYFGDSANAPYGDRPAEEVRELVYGHAARLLGECKALVLACNTATALCVAELRRRYPNTPIIGMEPALKPALAVGAHPRVLVLATATTLRERKFSAMLKRYGQAAEVVCVAASEIVKYVETGRENSEELQEHLLTLLAPYRTPLPDAVVLGCTHFPFVKEAILKALGSQVPIFDGARGTALQLERRLRGAGLLSTAPRRGAVTLTSSAPGILPLYARLLFSAEASCTNVESTR